MTTGNYIKGSSSSGSNASGPFVLPNNLEVASWSGLNYVPGTKPPRNLEYKKFRVVRAYEPGGKVVETVYPVLYDAFTKRPKRAYYEDHPYHKVVTFKNDVECWFRGNPYQSFVPVVPLSQQGQGFNTLSDGSFGWTATDDYKLIGKLRDQVAGSSFNAGVFLGEGREALHMIANSATRLYHGFLAFKRGDLATAGRILARANPHKRALSRTSIANNWLELQYGWLPLYSDIHSGAQFLAHHLNTPLQQTYKASRISQGITEGIGFQGNGTLKALGARSYREKHIKCILKEVDVAQLSGLTDPLSVAWELMPYSFVVDWFLPIGSWLESRGLASSLTGAFVTSDKTFRGFTSLTGGIESGWGPTELSPSEVPTSMYELTFDRSLSTSLTVPLPQVIPLEKAFSWKRAANAVALISNLRKESWRSVETPKFESLVVRPKPNLFFTQLPLSSERNFDWSRVIGAR